MKFTINEDGVTSITETQNFCIEVLLIDPPFYSEIEASNMLEILRPKRFHSLLMDVEAVTYPPSPLPYGRFILIKGRVFPSGVTPTQFREKIELIQAFKEAVENDALRGCPGRLTKSIEAYLKALEDRVVD